MSAIVATSISIEQAADIMLGGQMEKQVQMGDMTLTWVQHDDTRRVMVQASGEQVVVLQMS